MFQAPQITATAIVPTPAKGPMAHRVLCTTDHGKTTNVNGGGTFIGITISESESPDGPGGRPEAIAVQIAGAACARLSEEQNGLRYGDFLYATTEGLATPDRGEGAGLRPCVGRYLGHIDSHKVQQALIFIVLVRHERRRKVEGDTVIYDNGTGHCVSVYNMNEAQFQEDVF